MELERLFNPRKICVVGASDNPTRIGGRPIRILQEAGFTGPIYPVNPKYESVFGLACHPDVTDVPDDVDLYILCVPARAAVPTFRKAADQGARAAVVFGGGFAEVGPAGRDLQDQLRDVADAHGIPILGPNTLGYASFANGTFGTFATALETPGAMEPGPIALLSQSGGSAFNLFVEARSAGARFSHVVATGNEVNVTFSDLLSYFAEDPATSAIVGYMEGSGDGKRLSAALRLAQEVHIPVFLIKAGATERGALAAQSHTAQISGNDAAFEAAFTRYGVTRLTTFSDVVDVCRAIALPRIERGIAIATNSGGAAVYLSDLCERHDVPLANLSDRTRSELRSKLPAFASLANPIDFTAQVLNDPSLLSESIDVLDGDEQVEAILVFLGSMQSMSDTLIDTLRAVRDKCHKPMVVTWMGVTSAVRTRAEAAGLIVCDDPARVLRGMGIVRSNGRSALGLGAGETASGTEGETSVQPGDVVGEEDLKEQLREQGIRTPRGGLAASVGQAVDVAGEVGYPCVAKVVLPVLAHKSDAGAIRIGIEDADGMRDAFEALRASVPELQRVLVEEQVPIGTEIIVGVLDDETFGSRAVVGLGGVDVSGGGGVATLVAPYTPEYVTEELVRIGLNRHLARSGVDLGTAARGIARLLGVLDGMVAASPDIAELECNPVVFVGGEVVVLDALGIGRPAVAG